MPKLLPPRPNLEQLRKQAKDLLKSLKSGDPEAIKRIQENHPRWRSEEHTSELQSQSNLVCRLLLEKKNAPPALSADASLRILCVRRPLQSPATYVFARPRPQLFVRQRPVARYERRQSPRGLLNER